MAEPVRKSDHAFRTIGELASDLGVPQHILRYWETRFPQLRPLQRAGNRRYYRPDDVALARRIHRLLNQDGYTIRGVQQLLKAGGTAPSETESEPAPLAPAPVSADYSNHLPCGRAAHAAAVSGRRFGGDGPVKLASSPAFARRPRRLHPASPRPPPPPVRSASCARSAATCSSRIAAGWSRSRRRTCTCSAQTAGGQAFAPAIPQGISGISCGRTSVVPAAWDDQVVGARPVPVHLRSGGPPRRARDRQWPLSLPPDSRLDPARGAGRRSTSGSSSISPASTRSSAGRNKGSGRPA